MVSIEIIQGRNEVGGNCIKIEDEGSKLLFDQGIRFSVFRNYYSERVQPKGIPELRQLKIIPPIEAYQDVTTVYISHFHLDHLGLLANIPGKTTIKLPSANLFRVIENWYRPSPNWLAYVPPTYLASIEEATPSKTDENNVMAIPVEHSSYPAFSYLYFGSDANVLYTGDLRLTPVLDQELDERLYPTTLLKFFSEETDIRIDYLILEGTNIGSPLTPLTTEQFNKILSELVKQQKLIVVAVHNQEIENIIMIAKKANEIGKQLVIASNRVADIIDFWKNRLPTEISELLEASVLTSVMEKPFVNLDIIDEISFEKELENCVLIADLWHIIDSLRMLDPEKIPAGSPAILLTSEPHQEEAAYSEKLAIRWLRHLRLQPYRLRISGHYYPYQLKTILETIKPKNVIPVHTDNPSLFCSLIRSSLR